MSKRRRIDLGLQLALLPYVSSTSGMNGGSKHRLSLTS